MERPKVEARQVQLAKRGRGQEVTQYKVEGKGTTMIRIYTHENV